MYRLMLYYLIALLIIAGLLGWFGILPYNPLAIAISVLLFTGICWVTNTIFARTFKTPTNYESVYISALILALVITPIRSIHDLPFFFWVAVLSIASKYILAIFNKHIFNPVAFGLVITSIGISQSATWWVGTAAMLPFVLIGGMLIVRKLQRYDMVFSFIITALLTCFVFSLTGGTNLMTVLRQLTLSSPLFFFSFVMLTEPLTTPPTNRLQIYYGTLIGFLFAPQFHLFNIYTTPESALIWGNVFSYLVSPKRKLILKLKEKIQLAPDIVDFVFQTNKRFNFLPGQYLEWTLAGTNPDTRGNRRYFTIASSPTESTIRMGVRFYNPASSFKKALLSLNENSQIVASQLAGDFVLPKDKSQKLVFIAGGIGITPFRSMLKYLIDKNEKRDIVLFFVNKNAGDIVYKDVFRQAGEKLGIKVVYALTDLASVPLNWKGEKGRVSREMLKREVPDFRERLFYVSGPRSMVTGFEKVLRDLEIEKKRIVTDFFPGFA